MLAQARSRQAHAEIIGSEAVSINEAVLDASQRSQKVAILTIEEIEEKPELPHDIEEHFGDTDSSKGRKASKSRNTSISLDNSPVSGAKITQGLHGHNGVDFGSPVGTSVYAYGEGVVTVAKGSGWNGGYGSYILIDHADGTQTLYSHLSEVSVEEGQTVSKGQFIGEIGMTGKSTGPHLHFEMHGTQNPFS